MANDSQSDQGPPSRRQRFKGWAGSLALIIGAVVLALVLAELEPVQALATRIDAALALYPGLIAIPIALMVVGGALMLGAQLLPAPRRPQPPSDQALDAAAVPLEVSEEAGRWSRSLAMEATTEQVREAWRRRSWRYNRYWRIFGLMLIGAVLVSLGVTLLFILIGPPWIKLLVAATACAVAVWILWQFATK